MKKEADKGFPMEAQTASPMTLNGKRIVVLGGTSGIGFATAEMAASEGAAIVVASPCDAQIRVVSPFEQKPCKIREI